VADQRSTWLPFGDRTLALAPLVRSSMPSSTPRHPALASARPLSPSLSLATQTVKAPSPLPPRALRAPRALAFAPRLSSERLHVRLELLHLLHLLAGQDLPEVSRISRDCRHDPDSGEPLRCSILVSFLLSESR